MNDLFEFQKKANDNLIRQEQDAGSESLAMLRVLYVVHWKTSSLLYLFYLQWYVGRYNYHSRGKDGVGLVFMGLTEEFGEMEKHGD